MNKKKFQIFYEENHNQLPLFFKDFEFKKLLTTNKVPKNKIIRKNYYSTFYNSDKCKVEKSYKPNIRIIL